jgi:hypothetical protein
LMPERDPPPIDTSEACRVRLRAILCRYSELSSDHTEEVIDSLFRAGDPFTTGRAFRLGLPQAASQHGTNTGRMFEAIARKICRGTPGLRPENFEHDFRVLPVHAHGTVVTTVTHTCSWEYADFLFIADTRFDGHVGEWFLRVVDMRQRDSDESSDDAGFEWDRSEQGASRLRLHAILQRYSAFSGEDRDDESARNMIIDWLLRVVEMGLAVPHTDLQWKQASVWENARVGEMFEAIAHEICPDPISGFQSGMEIDQNANDDERYNLWCTWESNGIGYMALMEPDATNYDARWWAIELVDTRELGELVPGIDEENAPTPPERRQPLRGG